MLKDLSNLNKKELYDLGLISDSEFIDPTFSTKKFIRETTEKFYTSPEASETMRSEINEALDKLRGECEEEKADCNK